MSEGQGPVEPYVSADTTIPETTFLSIGLGLILAVVLGAANVYLGLYAGMTVSASIPAAVISMAILRGVFRRGTILENNIVQTMASTGESLAAGAIFTIPALVLIGVWKDFQFWPTTFIVMTGGLLGVVFMVPLRKALIVDREDLIYPEGVACAQVLIVGQEGGSGIRFIGLGLLLGALVKFLVTGIGVIRGTLEGALTAGKSVLYFGSDISPALIAVGYIVNLQVASQVFLGGVIAWVVALPLLGGFEAGGDTAVDVAWNLWSTEVRYIGVGTMLIGGIYSLWQVRSALFGGLSSLGVVANPNESSSGEVLLRTERNIPFTALMTLFAISVMGTLGLYQFLIGRIGVSVVAAMIMIIAAFVFAAVATYTVGLVGSSNSPVSGMTICALLMAAGVMLALGISGESAMLATLGVAGVVCCATCTAGDVAQDLKTGQLVGATPAKQQWTEILAVIVPAFVFAPVMTVLHETEGIGVNLVAPQATMFANLTLGFFGDGELPMTMIAIGVGIGIAILVADTALKRNNSSLHLHIMPIAVGIYLPLALAVPIFIGGLIRFATTPREKSPGSGQDIGLLVGSGMIAGEALMGIGLATLAYIGLELPSYGAPGLVSALALAALIGGFFTLSRRHS